MTCSIKSRLERMEARAAASASLLTAANDTRVLEKLLVALRDALTATDGTGYEAQILALDARLTADHATPADHIVLSCMTATNLTAAGTTAAGVVAIMARMFRDF